MRHAHSLPREEEPSDAAVVARVLHGDTERYALLVERHQERLYRHAYGMVYDRDVAADLVQDAFIKAYQKLATCKDPDRFGAWVFQVVRRRCLDYLKAPSRRTDSLEDVRLVSEDAGPEGVLEQSDTVQAVERALGTLPEAQREAFLLKHMEDLSYEEISERLGVGVSALKMRVMRAREALQAALAPERRDMGV